MRRHCAGCRSILLDNAIKYTPRDGAITVRVRAEPSSRGGQRATLEVEDSGPGIDEAERPRVFDRFYRGAGARQRDAEGTGLGLSIAQAIVARHQGTIEIGEGAGGRGCRVRVDIPGTMPSGSVGAEPLLRS